MHIVNWLAVAVLTLIHLVGLNAMYGHILCNGYYDALIHLRDHGPHVLPGSNNPILTRFSSFGPLDKLLTLAGVMFANVTDGSSPQLSLYAFHFAGQLVSIFTVMVIEGLREANRWGILPLSMIWACLMQSTGYGFIMPLYGIFHLVASGTAGRVDRTLAQAVRVPDLTALETLPWSLTIGYIIPTILMAIPFRSNVIHQWLGGFWQGFPVWVTLLQYVFRLFHVKLRSTKESEESKQNLKAANTRIHEQHVLHNAYLFSFITSAACHLGALAIVGARWLTPTLFSPLAQDTLTFREVFIPPPFYLCTEMKSMAAGIHNFFQYDQYIGSAAALVWVVALDSNSRKDPLSWRGWVKLVFETVGLSILAGPGGALVALMWYRDERLLSDDEFYENTS